MSYLNTYDSDNNLIVKVFPSSRRSTVQLSSRLMNEQSIVGIVNKLLNRDGFIITTEADFDVDNPFEFNVHGYYFKVSKLQEIIDIASSNQCWANITIDNTNVDFPELYRQDDEGYYKGVEFTETSQAGTSGNYTTYSLQILQRDSSATPWYMPEGSLARFYMLDGVLGDIDGGTI